MTLLEVVFLSFCLAADASAVSICKGVLLRKNINKNALIIGLWFGSFQTMMTAIGYYLGNTFVNFVFSVDHWIAFILLSFIGVNMIHDFFFKESDEDADTSFRTMFILAIATSIDALAVGVTLAFLSVNILLSSCLIGTITFSLSYIGVIVGRIFGSKYGRGSELIGGIILIIIGLKILLEHLEII